MPDVPVSALEPRQQKLVENARIALNAGNVDYAADVCGKILKASPGSVAVWRLHRAAVLQQATAGRRLTARLRGIFVLLRRLRRGPTEPLHRLETAAAILTADPENVRALRSLAIAAGELELPGTVVFALESVRELRPDDTENLVELGCALLHANRPAEALALADSVLKIRPVDSAAQDLMRRASIAQTVDAGHWATDPIPRSQPPVETVAVAPSPAAAAQVLTAADWTQRLIDDALARVAQEPGNVAHYLNLVSGYRRLGRWNQALDYVRKAKAHGACAANSDLEREEWELQALVLEHRFREAETMHARARDDEETRDRCERARTEWLEYRITQSCRLLEQHPTDVSERQKLAELYFETGRTDLAITEFRQIEKFPEVRVAALLGLGRAFKRRKQFDQAISSFRAAKGELETMDDTKKTIIYELGGCLLLRGDIEGAMEEFKSIHGVDSTAADLVKARTTNSAAL